MHTLGREIRFSINPFGRMQEQGWNSYAGKPVGTDGLCLFLSLWVELSSSLNHDTGFVVNVAEIDKAVRRSIVPVISNKISAYFGRAQLPSLDVLGGLLRTCWKIIRQEFPDKQLIRLTLDMNPYRSVSIQSEDSMELYYCEKFEFSAMHQLWNEKFDAAQNYKMFGKCANPAGHGHNYILEVKVASPTEHDGQQWLMDYQKVVKTKFLDEVDHKNLNIEVDGLQNLNPTVENLARFAWETLAKNLNHCKLCSITIWENDRTYCCYSG